MGMKRIMIFLLTNVAAVATLTAVALMFMWLFKIDPASVFAGSEWTVLLLFALLVGMTGALISLALSKTMVKVSMRCRTIDGSEGEAERWLVETVAALARTAGIKTPEVAIYPGEANAFATGARRNAALVAVSTRIQEQMSREELRAVLAHEVSHVANGDMVTMALTQGVVNTFTIFFAHLLAMVVQSALSGRDREERRGRAGGYFMYHMLVQLFQMVFGIGGMLVLMAYSRRREFAADAGSARLLGSPSPMIAALRRLGNLREGVLPDSLRAFGIAGGRRASLFSSHPSLHERIEALGEIQCGLRAL